MKGPAAMDYFEVYLKTFWCVYFFTTSLNFKKDFRWFTKMQTVLLNKMYLIDKKKK